MQSSHNQAIFSLTYVSSAVQKMNEDELRAIVESSRRNNERLSITGMLLYKDGNFMQTLEGTNESVTTLMNSIDRDPRHRGVIRLQKREVRDRCFGKWPMAFHNLDLIPRRDLKAFVPESFLDAAFRHQPESCNKLMLYFTTRM